MRGRYLLLIACAGLFSCNLILGMGDLAGPKSSNDDDDDDFNWDFDSSPGPTYDAGWTGTYPDANSTDSATATQKRVFVTSSTFPGNFGSVAAATSICQALANQSGLGGEWVAWLSDGKTRAIDALTFDGPYALLTGVQVVANRGALLDGGLSAAINVTESGGMAPASSGVWTGTFKSGSAGDSCTNWTSNSPIVGGTRGYADQKDTQWTDNGGQVPLSKTGWQCSTNARFYCFEK